uniref:Uncharacterized protein n=1 Tax=Pithovirus LCPAC401 TaxID=2506595 RepID=A0A481ZDD3_9VIRU|nr:MAG: uncharacterized protein LCPAC401_03190 [Pithovirus LCPAC401]
MVSSSRSKSFNPNLYDVYSKIHTNRKSSLTVKGRHGNSIEVNIDEIRHTLRKLYEYANSPISNLPKEIALEFKSIVKQADLLKNTDHYEMLWDTCQEIFSQYPGELNPFTVACYFLGCMMKTPGNMEEGCTLLCAGAMPPPPCVEEFSYCSKNVYYYRRTKKGCVLQVMGESQGSSQAYIYVNYNNIDSFPGFGRKDISFLISMGITEVCLYGYYDNHYYTLTTGFVSLKILPVSQEEDADSDDSNSGIWIALCVIGIIILILIFWFIWRNVRDDMIYEHSHNELGYRDIDANTSMISVK